MKEGNRYVNKCDLSSLRILGTVGETIKPPEWNWYKKLLVKIIVQLLILGGKLKQEGFLFLQFLLKQI